MNPSQPYKPVRVPHAQAAAPFSARPPSPPSIIVPTHNADVGGSLSIVPSFVDIDSSDLTEEDLAIITRGWTQEAVDGTMNWQYESRREAQAILDFLYLGPSTVARDRDWLASRGITMVLVARDTTFSQVRIMSVEKNCAALGIAAEYIDTTGRMGLVRAFPDAVRKINDHMLEIYRSQAVEPAVPGADKGGHMTIDDAEGFRRGRVLVCCETGNDRSAAIVAAYIISLFGTDLVKTLQFVTMQRFCAVFDDDTKRLLQAYQDIVLARRDVNRQKHALQLLSPFEEQQQHDLGLPPVYSMMTQTKRNIDVAMVGGEENQDQDMESSPQDINHDMDRYLDRPVFAPFVDGGLGEHERNNSF